MHLLNEGNSFSYRKPDRIRIFFVLLLNPILFSCRRCTEWPVCVTIKRGLGREIRANWFTVVRYYLVNPFTLGKWLDKERVCECHEVLTSTNTDEPNGAC